MGHFVAGRKIYQLDQLIYVNAAEDARVWCDNIVIGSGMGSASAGISVPELLFDTFARDLRDAFVQVYVKRKGGQYFANPDYSGYLLTDNGEVSPNEDRRAFGSHTITALLGRVHVGQVK